MRMQIPMTADNFTAVNTWVEDRALDGAPALRVVKKRRSTDMMRTHTPK